MLSVATQILRGYSYNQVKTVCEALVESKIRSVEVTLNTDDALTMISRLSEEFGEKLFIGAGTVITLNDAKEAIQAGAKFILSPILMTNEMIDYCKEHDVITVSGALTPTEIYEAFSRGSDIVKVFPVKEFSFNYAYSVCEPLGDLPLMAVGGVNHTNVNQYLKNGFKYVG
ncbi:MAG: 2-dehydro-3-deoxyphosphogluconate aldolase, partial [Bacillaceae bacterium]